MHVNFRHLFAIFLLLSLGCNDRNGQLRRYRETVIQPAAPTPSTRLAWNTPDGWIEQPATEMRLATFKVDSAECTIITFPGNVGGSEANVRRWLGQLQIQPPETDFQKFMSDAPTFQTEGGFQGTFFDFESLIASNATTSMLATIIPMDGQMIFIKLMGDKTVVADNREKFKALNQSLRKK